MLCWVSYWSLVKEGLTAANVRFAECPGLVRGLDYYENTVFEFVHQGLIFLVLSFMYLSIFND